MIGTMIMQYPKHNRCDKCGTIIHGNSCSYCLSKEAERDQQESHYSSYRDSDGYIHRVKVK